MVGFMELLKDFKASRHYQRKLKKVQENAMLNPENLSFQVQMGDLLAKLKRKKEAVIAYELAAQRFIQRNLFAHAIALEKIIFRLEPPKDDEERTKVLGRLYEQMLTYKEKAPKADETALPESETSRPTEKGWGDLRLKPRAIAPPVS